MTATENVLEALDRLHDLAQELDLVVEREEMEHVLEFLRGAAESLLEEVERLKTEQFDSKLNSEAIGLMRQHLESVGIYAAFADDAAALAAQEIRSLRSRHERLREAAQALDATWEDNPAAKGLLIARGQGRRASKAMAALRALLDEEAT